MVKPQIATRIVNLRLAGKTDNEIAEILFNAGFDGKDISDTFDSIDGENALSKLAGKLKAPVSRGINLPLGLILVLGGLGVWLVVRKK